MCISNILIYEAEDLDEYKNDNINFLEPISKNMTHAVEHNDYINNVYDQLLSAELMLPNESTDRFFCGIVIQLG